MDIAAKQAELDAVTWYHEYDFGNGLRTRTHCDHIESHRHAWAFLEAQLAKVDFRGKSVLDIGTWDGYWSFRAEKRGARSVLASDDLSQNWSQGRGIHLAKELLGSSIEIDQNLSVYDLASRGRKFDVILFLGVFYHLHDPFYALSQIRHCCHPGTVVVMSGSVGKNLTNKSHYDFPEHGCEWLPGEGAMRQLLEAAYFTEPTVAYQDPPTGRLGWRWRLKMCREVLGGSRAAMQTQFENVSMELERIHGTFTCAPHEGKVDLHAYRPPFGLHAYDPRFRDAALHRAG